MRTAEHSQVYVILFQSIIHIIIVHAPDTLLIAEKRAEFRNTSGILERVCETYVSRTVQKDFLSGCSERLNRRAYAPEYAVLVTDILLIEACYMITSLMPPYNRIKVLVSRSKVSVGRVLHPLDDRFGDRRNGCEVHIGYPHGYRSESVTRCPRSDCP